MVPRFKLGVTISPVLSTKKILAALSSCKIACLSRDFVPAGGL